MLEKALCFCTIDDLLCISSASPSLRLGLDLCMEEKVYLRQRRPKVFDGLSAFLDKDDQPESLSEVSGMFYR